MAGRADGVRVVIAGVTCWPSVADGRPVLD